MRLPKSTIAVCTPSFVLLLLLLQLLFGVEAQRSADQTPNRGVIVEIQQHLQQPERPIAATNSSTTPSPSRHINAMVPASSSGPVIRLRGSNRNEMPHVGRVEVFYRGRWGVVCDDDWDQNDADVACRMLGYYRGAAAAVGGSEFGSGAWTADDIVLDDVSCDGSEQSLERCQFNDGHNCDIEELAGVRCHPEKAKSVATRAASCQDSEFSCYVLGTCVSRTRRCDGLPDCMQWEDERNCESTLDDYRKTVAMRLQTVPKTSYRNMSLERCGRLCSKSREYVCKAFAFRSSTEYCLLYESGSDVAGTTADSSYDLYELRSLTDMVEACASDEFTCKAVKRCLPARFVCNNNNDCGDRSDEQRCNELSISLVGGQSIYEGRVEITYNGLRGTICDDEFDDKDAQVICRSFGFTGPAVAHGRAKFGAGGGVIWIDDLQCSGSEPNVAACSRSAWGVSNCKHDQDAAVTCSRASTSSVFSSPPPRPAATTAGQPAVLPSCGQRIIRALPTDVGYVEPRGNARIVGGREAIHGDYPWQVGVKKGGSHWCGGTILNDRWILSAAHCFYKLSMSLFSIIVGDFDITMVEATEETFYLEQIILHEQYRDDNDYDFALLKIQTKIGGRGIQFSQYVQPACLPSSQSMIYPVGTYCQISGWGSMSKNAFHIYPNRLQAAEVPIMDDSLCLTLYRNDITARMFCAGFKEGGIDTCKGDSGGPLVCNMNGQFTVLGVTSFGNGCALPNAPGVYAKVSTVLPWIQRQISA